MRIQGRFSALSLIILFFISFSYLNFYLIWKIPLDHQGNLTKNKTYKNGLLPKLSSNESGGLLQRNMYRNLTSKIHTGRVEERKDTNVYDILPTTGYSGLKGDLIYPSMGYEGRSCGGLTQNPRVYMNPVRALLEQHQWKGEFLEEIYKGSTPQEISRDLHIDVANMAGASLGADVQTRGSNHSPNTPGVCCGELFQGNQTYLNTILKSEQTFNNIFPSPDDLIQKTKNCEHFIKDNGYIHDFVSDNERNFPLAYSILMYKDVGQVEHLLRAIYRPQNYYCIHVDQKSEDRIHVAARALSDCFDNVFIASRSVRVEWCDSGSLDADLICLRDLWEVVKNKKEKWRYFINLTGQEFPLKTNWEMVQILRSYNGAVDVSTSLSKEWKRWDCIHKFVNNEHVCTSHNRPPRYNFTTAQGQSHVALTFRFAEFALFSPIALELYDWLRPTFCPDESFFATLFSSPQLNVPSAYTGPPNTEYRSTHPMIRYKRWYDWRGCKGHVQRYICLVSLWDLAELRARPEMFVNKLEADYHPPAYHCLEELHHRKTLEEREMLKAGITPGFDTRPYTQLPWVRHHL